MCSRIAPCVPICVIVAAEFEFDQRRAATHLSSLSSSSRALCCRPFSALLTESDRCVLLRNKLRIKAPPSVILARCPACTLCLCVLSCSFLAACVTAGKRRGREGVAE